MKVGIVIGSKHRGGAERQVFLLAQGLINKGIDVTVFIMYRPTCFKPKIPFGNIPCIYLWNTRYTENMSLKYFSYLLKRLNISILHMFILGSIEFGVRAAQSAGIKNTIGSVRSIEFVDDAEERSRLSKVCKKIKYVTGNCNAIRNFMVDLEVCPAEKIKVINNGIHLVFSSKPSAVKPNENEFRILFASMLKDIKNPLQFINAALLVLDTHPQCKFIIAGDGPLRNSIEQVINKSKNPDRFSLLGSVPLEQIPYQNAHLVVSTSKSEGSSNTILEALAHGIPVVATAVGGTVEILEGHTFGKLVQLGDADETADAIREFCIKSPKEREIISRDAQSFINNNYSFDRMVDEHIAFYKEIMES